tara:strand:+ start:1274 stop:1705 length:432 start_codon:yes stop_codon:yes gene_type:complete
MASRKEYTYQIKGNKFSLLEKDFTTTDGMNYTYSGISGDGVTDDVPSGSTVVKSPLSDVTDGIELEYAYSPIESLVDEGSEIDLPPYLSKALVYYLKGKIAEDGMNLEVKEYMMREFRRMIEKYENSKVAGPRQVMPGNHAIR